MRKCKSLTAALLYYLATSPEDVYQPTNTILITMDYRPFFPITEDGFVVFGSLGVCTTCSEGKPQPPFFIQSAWISEQS